LTARRAILALALTGLLGCIAGSPAAAGLFGPDPPGVLTLNLVAGADQNPDSSGHPSSIAVRLFMLADVAKFTSADVFALNEREQQTLGPDGLGSEQFVLAPRETKTVTRELKPGVRFIGVAVLFRDIDRAQWRVVSPVAATGTTRRAPTIGALSAKLAGS
jgi:type VI secretion system protein VasD